MRPEMPEKKKPGPRAPQKVTRASTPAGTAGGGDRRVALLRGINVGGKNRLAMADLAAAFEACGCSRVSTFIQSGNVIFDAKPAVYARLAVDLPAKIRAAHGLTVPVVLRSREELAAVPAANPYADRALDDKLFHVMFLADTPAASAAQALDPSRSEGDEFVVVGREIFLWMPNGVARSKLTNAWFDKQLATVSTARNWRTVLKLIELSR